MSTQPRRCSKPPPGSLFHRLLAAAAVLLASPPLSGIAQTLERGPESRTVEVGRLLELTMEHSPPDGFVLLKEDWRLYDPGVDWLEIRGDRRTTFVMTPPLGSEGRTYRVFWEALYINWDARDHEEADESFLVTVAGRTPPVEPGPTPPDDPQPDPEPAKTTLAVTVYESLNQEAPQQSVLARASLEEMGIQSRIVDVDQLDVPAGSELSGVLDSVRGKTLPLLVLMAGNRVKRVVPLPPTAQQVVDTVRTD